MSNTASSTIALGADDIWEFYKDPSNEWRWRRTAVNGNIVGASTQGYSQRAPAVLNAIRAGYKAKGKGKGKTGAHKTRNLGADDGWEFYKDKKGEHRWRRLSPNGRIVGASSEGYASAEHAEQNAIRAGYIPGKSTLLYTPVETAE